MERSYFTLICMGVNEASYFTLIRMGVNEAVILFFSFLRNTCITKNGNASVTIGNEERTNKL